MRRLGVFVLLLLLAGCTAQTPRPTNPSTAANPGSDAPIIGVAAPTLPLGRAWTYRASGINDVEPEITIVVAPAQHGYLFAGADEGDLTGQIIWPHPWFGPRDANLNQPPDGVARGMKWFDFPLVDGKTWTLWADGPVATAQAASVLTPKGSEPGFSIAAQDGDQTMEWDYAPSIGFFTHYLQQGETKSVDLRLHLVDERTTYAWYERGPHQSVEWNGGPESRPHGTLVVPAGYDAVLAIAFGDPGVHGAIVPPEGAARTWSFEGDGCCSEQDDWTPVLFPATPGNWELLMSGEEAYGGMETAAVKWIRAAI